MDDIFAIQVGGVPRLLTSPLRGFVSWISLSVTAGQVIRPHVMSLLEGVNICVQMIYHVFDSVGVCMGTNPL